MPFKDSFTIVLPKPGKPPDQPTSYRPVIVLDCLGILDDCITAKYWPSFLMLSLLGMCMILVGVQVKAGSNAISRKRLSKCPSRYRNNVCFLYLDPD
jgi:hypothetical protein